MAHSAHQNLHYHPLHFENGELWIENTPITQIAEQYGTPTYIYSRKTIEANWQAYDYAFDQIPHRICYAVKANSNIAILQLLAKKKSGFDIVSLGELERVLKAGGDPALIVFSGVGKQRVEIQRALDIGVGCFNVESEPELVRLNTIALEMGKIANIAIRVNPNVHADTHDYISTGKTENKFGIDINKISQLCRQLDQFKGIKLKGIASHIGSQLVSIQPFIQAFSHLIEIETTLRSQGIILDFINIGGGLGITYQEETPPTISDYVKAIATRWHAHHADTKPMLIIEPGRSIVGNAGFLLTHVEYIKETPLRNFAIVDAGMNDLLRPALYGAWQAITPIIQRAGTKKSFDIAGPVCESSDFLGKNRELALESGDLLIVHGAGAYGFSMASNYNSRLKPAEILVDGKETHIIRRRETYAELFAAENLL